MARRRVLFVDHTILLGYITSIVSNPSNDGPDEESMLPSALPDSILYC
ncbi:hypothetical protein HRbin04_00299 [archaeon HR04]|nr:hypothetical protein HRbin04_00299 [archaeon HR04]